MIQSRYINIWRYLQNIQNDEKKSRILNTQLTAGSSRIRHLIKSTCVMNHFQVRNAVWSYQDFKDNNVIDSYLRAMLSLQNELFC